MSVTEGDEGLMDNIIPSNLTDMAVFTYDRLINSSLLSSYNNITTIWRDNNNNSDQVMRDDLALRLYYKQKCEYLASYKEFRFYVDVFVVGFFIITGLIGNVLAILVVRADNMNSTVSYLLQALAIADNSYLIACLFMQTIKALFECSNWMPVLLSFYPHIEPYIWPLASIAQTICVWLVVLVTLDRYIAICHPFNTTYVCTQSRAKKACYGIIILAIIYNIPRFLEHKTELRYEICSNTTVLTSSKTEFRKNYIYFTVYKTCMYFLFRVFIPIGSLAVFNTKLIIALKGATRSHAALTRTTPPRNDSFTRILVVVVTVFIVCELPSFILRFVLTICAFTGVRLNVWYYATLSNLLLTINSSTNCLVYCVSGKRFRKILIRLIGRLCFGNKAHQQLIGEDASNLNGTLSTMSRRSTKRNKNNIHLNNGRGDTCV